MKRKLWNLLIAGALFLTIATPDAFARGMAGGGGGRGGGGGERGGGERGGGGQRGGGGERGSSERSGGRGNESGGGGARGEGAGRGAAGNNAAGGGSAAARNPSFSNPSYSQRSGSNFNNTNINRNQSGASGAQGAAAGAAYSNRNQPNHSGAQGAAAGAAYSNRNQPNYSGAQGAAAGAAYSKRNQPAYSGAQGAAFGAAAAGYHPSSANYGFYHGSYNGNWGAGGYGAAAAVARPMAWGMGVSTYNSGYLGYSNPYYTGGSGGGAGSGGGYDYSQPIPAAASTPVPADQAAGQTPATEAAAESPEDQLNPAIDAFKKGDYTSSINIVNQLLKTSPSDAVLHEFRALILFAKHDYQQAAATIHSVLAVGPGWDWTTLSSLYSDIGIYNKQFLALETFVEGHPQDGAAHFLLAYHYLTCGHPDSAAGEFKRVVELVPTDKVAADLLKMISPPMEGNNQPPEPEQPKPSSKPVDAAGLAGTWKAARDDGSTFELTLAGDSNFTWKYTQQQKTQEFGGTYSVQGNLLVLERKDGSSMVGQMTPDGPKKFNFKLLGAPGSDPGLNFGR
jgi:hypothetical protein